MVPIGGNGDFLGYGSPRISAQLPPTKTTIAAVAINRHFRSRGPPLPPLTTNNNHWLLVVVIVNCVVLAMVVIDGSDSGRC
jgi:hypothetical protein